MKYLEISRRNEDGLASPTPLTNALRRPKSPRTGRIAPTILAAERFQQMDPPKHQPLQVHHHHQQQQQPQQQQQEQQRQQATKKSRSKTRQNPRPDAPNPQTPNASDKQHRQHRRISSSPPTMPFSSSSSKIKSRAYAKHNSKRVATNCVDRGAAIGKQVSDCIVMTSDLYRREFAKNHRDRGDDAAFFMYQNNPTMNHHDDDDDDDTDPVSSSSNASSASHERLRGPPKILNIVKKDDSHSDAATPFISNRGVRYPQAKNITDMSGDMMLEAMPSPQRDHVRRPRGQHTEELYEHDKANNFYATATDPRFEILSDYSDLRELRLQMMRRDLEDENERPENQLSKAMQSIRTQDATITTLRQELDDTRELLERYRLELQETRDQAEKRTAIAERSSAKIFRDRIDVEQRLRIEIKQNQQLMEQINSLHDEAHQLKLSLKSSDSSGKQQQHLRAQRSLPDSVSTQSDGKLSEEAIATETKKLKANILELKTEIVDLRTQLAEAKAARLAAEEEKAELKAENEGLRSETRMLRHQVNELRSQIEDLMKEADTSKEAGDKEAQELKEELKRVKHTLAQSNAELISNYKKSERLEEVLTESQEEALKLRGQVCDFMKAIEETKRDAENKVKVSEEEAKRLQDEVVNVKKQLAKTNSHIVIQASAQKLHRERVRKELDNARKAAQSLQTKIMNMDSKLANAESEARGIRAAAAASLKDDVSVVQSTTTEGLVELVHRKSDEVMDLLRRRLDASSDASQKSSDLVH